MDSNLDIQIEEALKSYLASRIEDQVDYRNFYLYSIVTNSTAIEGSTVTEIENQLLFDEDIAAKGRSLTEQMMNVDLKDAYFHAFKLVDSRDNEDSAIVQDIMLRHHIANLNRRVSQHQENDTVNAQHDTVNVNDNTVTGLKKSLQNVLNNTDITHSEIMETLHISESTAKRATRDLKKLGYIAREGSDKTGRWVILK